MQFVAQLDLEDTMHLTGFEALDFCRKHGLPERARIKTHATDASQIEENVSEEFARLYFENPTDGGPETVTDFECIDVAHVLPGDLQLMSPFRTGDSGVSCTIQLNPEMPPERFRELYAAAYTRRKKEQERTHS